MYRIKYEDLRSGREMERNYDDERSFLAAVETFKNDLWVHLIEAIYPNGKVIKF